MPQIGSVKVPSLPSQLAFYVYLSSSILIEKATLHQSLTDFSVATTQAFEHIPT
jgi:hypothetical protein